MKLLRRGILALTAALVLAGCTRASLLTVTFPPIGTSAQRVPGKVVWHDLVTRDPERVQTFYAGLFGWQFEEVTRGYAVARNGDRLVGGVARIDSATSGSQWLAQVSVLRIDDTVAAARAAGGKVLLGPLDLRGRGRVAVLADPQGAVFGAIESAAGDPADRDPAVGDWLWHEVWATAPDAVAPFYDQLFGFALNTAEVYGKPYRYFAAGGRPRVGLVQKPDPQLGAAWVSYVRVDDAAQVSDRVAGLGGKVLLAPRADIRAGTVGIIADPGGGALLIQQLPTGKKG